MPCYRPYPSYSGLTVRWNRFLVQLLSRCRSCQRLRLFRCQNVAFWTIYSPLMRPLPRLRFGSMPQTYLTGIRLRVPWPWQNGLDLVFSGKGLGQETCAYCSHLIILWSRCHISALWVQGFRSQVPIRRLQRKVSPELVHLVKVEERCHAEPLMSRTGVSDHNPPTENPPGPSDFDLQGESCCHQIGCEGSSTLCLLRP